VNNPIPANLKSEAKKAVKILREFTEISNRMGPDKLIPAHVIAKAQGLAILSVFKAGFMITARGGSGIVIARLTDGRWSAPSVIGIAGLDGGFEIGLEGSDFVIILNQRRALDAFSKGDNLTLGGNFSVAVGPLGRYADVAFHSTAAVYSYCKSRGLYAGVSLFQYFMCALHLIRFYGQDIHASAILNVEPPPEAYDLYTILQDYTCKPQARSLSVLLMYIRVSLFSQMSSAPARPPRPPTQRAASSYTPKAQGKTPSDLSNPHTIRGALVVTAVHPITGQQPGDLSFYDWWEGELRGQVWLFPANFVSYS
uniref:SH3 and SYLF domain containing 1 n=1 Tax=Sinocyclocheilus grahami TaxID=75366 RepID=A0A672RCS6_SINGR